MPMPIYSLWLDRTNSGPTSLELKDQSATATVVQRNKSKYFGGSNIGYIINTKEPGYLIVIIIRQRIFKFADAFHEALLFASGRRDFLCLIAWTHDVELVQNVL